MFGFFLKTEYYVLSDAMNNISAFMHMRRAIQVMR